MFNYKAKTANPRKGKAEETRLRILNAAIKHFQRKGFATATMREIAEEADVALGAAYYYFDSKEAIVLAIYRRLQEEVAALAPRILTDSHDLRTRLSALIDFKFKQLERHRRFLGVLFGSAADPMSPLSPFGEETREIRDQSMGMFAEAIEGSRDRIHPQLKPHLPRLFWLYHMGLLLFWLHDGSAGHARTRRLLDVTLDLIMSVIKLFGSPFMGPLRRTAMRLFELAPVS